MMTLLQCSNILGMLTVQESGLTPDCNKCLKDARGRPDQSNCGSQGRSPYLWSTLSFSIPSSAAASPMRTRTVATRRSPGGRVKRELNTSAFCTSISASDKCSHEEVNASKCTWYAPSDTHVYGKGHDVLRHQEYVRHTRRPRPTRRRPPSGPRPTSTQAGAPTSTSPGTAAIKEAD